MKKISIIIPCYNEEDSIPLFYKEINKVFKTLSNYNHELIFINDGSKDKTIDVIRDLSNKDKHIKYINFSRNFGKEAAMLAGLESSKGDYVAIMDADLQDPPSLLPDMIDYIEKENYDCIATRRVTRKGEPVIRSFFARLFYKIINKMSKIEMVDGARDYRLMTKQVKDAIVSMKEYNRFSKGLTSFVGFDTKWIEYENVERLARRNKMEFLEII